MAEPTQQPMQQAGRPESLQSEADPALGPPGRPRVVIFRNSMLPRSETFILAQARALERYQPVFAAVHPAADSLPELPHTIFVTKNGRWPGRLARRWYWSTGIAPAFHARLRRQQAALLHAHFALDGAAALAASAACGLPLVVTLHGYDVTRSERGLSRSPEGRLFLARRRRLWQQAAVFLCVSEFIRRQALGKGFPADRLEVLYTGTDLGFFRPWQAERDPALIVFAGRLVEKKGCADLLAAMSLLAGQGVRARAVILGDGPLRRRLEGQAAAGGLECEFAGMQPRAAVREWLNRARIFCVPSKTAADGDSEGLGMVFAEAQAMGTPVVSYRHGGIPEVVAPGETGLLAEEGDVAALARSLARYLTDNGLWQAHRQAGMRRVAENFDLARQTPKLEAVYDQVVAAAAAGKR